MANTTNLNMVKPAGTDHALISVINSNMDIIDGAVGALPSGTTLQGEIDSANTAIGNITNYVDLGNMATQSALETALDTKLSSMGEFTNVTIRFLVTSSFAGFAANTYVGTLSKGGTSGSYAAALLESIIGTSKAIVKATKNTSWRFEELALKSDIDDLNGKKAYKADKRIATNSDATFTFGSYYTSAIILATSGTDGILYIYSNGWLVPVKTASGISITLSSNYLTVTVHNGTASNLEVGCFSTNQEIVTN